MTTSIPNRFVKNGENPALLFMNPVPREEALIRGHRPTPRNADKQPFPLLINLFASQKHLAWALGHDSLAGAVARRGGLSA